MARARKAFFNIFISTIIVLGLYSVVSPYLFGGVYDVNHKFLCIFTFICSGVLLYLCDFKISLTTFTILLLILFSAFCILLGGYFSFSYYTKWLIFATSLLLYCIVFSHVGPIKPGVFRLLYISAIIQLIFHVYAACDSRFYINMSSGKYLLLAFDNKNSAAMQLLFLGSLFVLFERKFQASGRKWFSALNYLFIAITIILIYLTGSRSSLIAIIFILPFLFWDFLFICINRKTILLGILFPLLFGAIYVIGYKAGLENLTLWGRKIYNGRQYMWIGVFEGFPFKWIFGMFSEYITGDGSQPFQLHNGWIDMIATYGGIATAILIGVLYRQLCKIICIRAPINYLIVVCVIGLLLQSTGEAALINGSRAIFVCLIFLFRKTQDSSLPPPSQ